MVLNFKTLGYIPGLADFLVSAFDEVGKPLVLSPEDRESWSPTWRRVNEDFEKDCDRDSPAFGWMKDSLFVCWDGNHRLNCWSTVAREDPTDEKYHPRVECRLLDFQPSNIPEITTLMRSRNRLEAAEGSSIEGIKGGWIADAQCAKEVLSRKIEDFRQVLREYPIKSRMVCSRRTWYSGHMTLDFAVRVLSNDKVTAAVKVLKEETSFHVTYYQSKKRWAELFHEATRKWRSSLPKYAAMVDPALGVEFWETVKDLCHPNLVGSASTGFTVTPEVVRKFASASVSNRLRCELLKAHFIGNERTKNLYQHPLKASGFAVQVWLQRWGTWSQVECIALYFLKLIMSEELASDSTLYPDAESALTLRFQKMRSQFSEYLTQVRRELWDVAWVREDNSKQLNPAVLICRAKRALFRFFLEFTGSGRFCAPYEGSSTMPPCMTFWSDKTSKYSMWNMEDLALNVRTEWEFRNCPWYVEGGRHSNKPQKFISWEEFDIFHNQQSGAPEEDHWFLPSMQPQPKRRQRALAKALELPKKSSKLVQLVERYTLENNGRRNFKRKRGDHDEVLCAPANRAKKRRYSFSQPPTGLGDLESSEQGISKLNPSRNAKRANCKTASKADELESPAHLQQESLSNHTDLWAFTSPAYSSSGESKETLEDDEVHGSDYEHLNSDSSYTSSATESDYESEPSEQDMCDDEDSESPQGILKSVDGTEMVEEASHHGEKGSIEVAGQSALGFEDRSTSLAQLKTLLIRSFEASEGRKEQSRDHAAGNQAPLKEPKPVTEEHPKSSTLMGNHSTSQPAIPIDCFTDFELNQLRNFVMRVKESNLILKSEDGNGSSSRLGLFTRMKDIVKELHEAAFEAIAFCTIEDEKRKGMELLRTAESKMNLQLKQQKDAHASVLATMQVRHEKTLQELESKKAYEICCASNVMRVRYEKELRDFKIEKANERSILVSKRAQQETKLRQLEGQTREQEMVIKELTTQHQKDVQALQKEKESNMCQICLDNPRDVVILTCMHFLYCNECIAQHRLRDTKCPSCRVEISGACKLRS